jgi:metal-dependent amidase/aminoacylase/carboxypeptidase family protein
MPVIPEIAAFDDKMIAWRRDFHMHPELGFHETRTGEAVATRLGGFGIEVHRGLGGTGVVGTLRAGTGNGCIGLGADMDVLPIEERDDVAHRQSALRFQRRHPADRRELLRAVGGDDVTKALGLVPGMGID